MAGWSVQGRQEVGTGTSEGAVSQAEAPPVPPHSASALSCARASVSVPGSPHPSPPAFLTSLCAPLARAHATPPFPHVCGTGCWGNGRYTAALRCFGSSPPGMSWNGCPPSEKPPPPPIPPDRASHQKGMHPSPETPSPPPTHHSKSPHLDPLPPPKPTLPTAPPSPPPLNPPPMPPPSPPPPLEPPPYPPKPSLASEGNAPLPPDPPPPPLTTTSSSNA